MCFAPSQDEIAGHTLGLERHDDGGQEHRAPHHDQHQQDEFLDVSQLSAMGLSPSFSNRMRSESVSGLGVVSSLGPQKMELAPARKHSAWVSSLISSRPADSRTMDLGMVMRATAMVRTKSSGSSGEARDWGVPSICTRALIGTLSGCTGRVASAWIRPTRSSALS